MTLSMILLLALAAPPDWREVRIAADDISGPAAEQIIQLSPLFSDAYEPNLGKLVAENKLVREKAAEIYREASKPDASAEKVRLIWREMYFAINRLNTWRANLESQAKAQNDPHRVAAAQLIDKSVQTMFKRANDLRGALNLK